jgi:hypothetical protein
VARVTGPMTKAICAGDRAGQRRFSAWNPVSCQHLQPGNMPDSNVCTAAHRAAVAVLSCCTHCSIRSNFASDQVELSGLEPLTSCMPYLGMLSSAVADPGTG